MITVGPGIAAPVAGAAMQCRAAISALPVRCADQASKDGCAPVVTLGDGSVSAFPS